MSLYRLAAKVDLIQQKLVKDLRTAGIDVWVIRQPCDLLLRFWCNRHHDYCWQPLEAKTLHGRRTLKVRKDWRQEKQEKFLRETMTPIATDFDSAWAELNKRHSLGRVEPMRVMVDNPTPRLFRQT